MISFSRQLKIKIAWDKQDAFVKKQAEQISDATIAFRQFQERETIYEKPYLLVRCPHLPDSVHFNFEVSYAGACTVQIILFGVNDDNFDQHPKRLEILKWAEDQIAKLG